MHKIFESLKTLVFLSFSVLIWDIFTQKNCNKLFVKAYWTTHFCLADTFKRPSPQSWSKIWEKMHKTIENLNTLEGFLSLSVSFWDFFKMRTAIIFSEKPTGQQIRAMLSISIILIYWVYQKIDKICINTVKIENFLVFCHFWVFFFPKKRISFFIIDYWTTHSCFVEPLQHSDPRHLSEDWQKIALKRKQTVKFWNFVRVIMGSTSSFPKNSEKLCNYISHEAKYMIVEFCG